MQQGTCERCGESFDRTQPSKRYCTDRCQRKASKVRLRQQREQAECQLCGSAFERSVEYGKDARRQVYCSDACHAEAKVWRYRTTFSCPLHWADCSECGLPFTARHGAQRCQACRSKPRLWFMGYCIRCAEPFVTDQPSQRSCSMLCAKRHGRQVRRARQRGSFVEPVYRQRVYERDGWTCGICRKPVNRTTKVPAPAAATLDHIVPLALGGEHSYANVQTAHFICNASKSARCEGQLHFAA